MKNDLMIQRNALEEQEIVIPDECGDSLWEAVLAQDTNVNAPVNNVTPQK